ncbi:hypothetical protein F4775DRAFT_590140 [Biscogniauxia sp. FL1348]|nr:hypothetical protein F4775DRAFT_590140 [Biscogniauxia sp. FL1348]
MAQSIAHPSVSEEDAAGDSAATLYCPQCPQPALSIDEDGDLTLHVGEFRCSHICEEEEGEDENQLSYGAFTVCSKALSRASPVMKKMLYGGFAESKKPGNNPWTVHLPEDDPKALEVILNIIHLRFDQVSSGVTTLDDLYNITVLTDKYDLTHVIRPWVAKWRRKTMVDKSSWQESQVADGYFEKRLWIAWELGDLKDFTDVLGWITSHCYVRSSGMLTQQLWFSPSHMFFHHFPEPPGAYEIISSSRLRIIEGLLTHVETLVDCLIRGERAGLWPIPESSDYHESLSTLLDSIKTLKIVNSCSFNHCRPTNLSALLNPSVDMRPRLSDMHKKHCFEQAKKSGVKLPKS